MCYNAPREVNEMEENMEMEQVSAEEMNAEVLKQEGYTPRPKWQIWAARIGLVIMIVCVILYYLHIFRGGLL